MNWAVSTISHLNGLLSLGQKLKDAKSKQPQAGVLLILLLLLPALIQAGVCNVAGNKAYGDCGNVTINTGPPKDIQVWSYRSVSGVTGNVVVHPGGRLDLSGVSGDIIVKGGGRADISGVSSSVTVYGTARVTGITGPVRVRGGTFTLEGQASSVTGIGEMNIRRHSVIGGSPQDGYRISHQIELKKVQACLSALGYSPGPADGLNGPRTRKAAAAYQATRGLPISGEWADIVQRMALACD